MIECLKRFEVKYKNKSIIIETLDELIMELVEEVYKKGEEKNSLNIVIEEEITIVYTLIALAFTSYYVTMKNPENNILDSIKQGEKVCYKREVYTFEGYNKIRGKKYIKLKNKAYINNIPMDVAYEITIYKGKATRINKKKKLDIKSKSNIAKAIISEAIGININELNGVITKSNLLIIKGKERIIDIIESITIIFREVEIPFTEIFSIGYWSDSEKGPQILKNSIKEDTLFHITTNMTTALDLIDNDEKIKNIIIIGEKVYRDSYETELRTLSLCSNIEKLMIFNRWEDSGEYDYFLDEDNEFVIRAFTKKILENKMELKGLNHSDLQLEYYEKVKNWIGKNIKVTFIKEARSFNKYIKEVLELLNELGEFSDNSEDGLKFLKIAYYLCNKIQSSIIPLKYCIKNRGEIFNRLDILKNKKCSFPKTRVEYEIMSDIIVIFEKVLEEIEYSNEKFRNIKKIAKRRKKGILLLKNKDEILEMKRYLLMNGIGHLHYEVFKKDIDFSGYEYVILPFYLNGEWNLRTTCIKEIEIISYEKEFYRYEKEFRRETFLLKKIHKKNRLTNNEVYKPNIEYINILESDIEKGEEKAVLNEERIENRLQENYIKLFMPIEMERTNQVGGGNKILAKKVILLKNGEYVLLTENYNISCIDRTKGDIFTKVVDEIEVGDEVIFIKNPKSEKMDIIKDVIGKLLREKDFIELYGEYFEKNQLWKKVLIEYMNENSFTEKDICKKFKDKGQNIIPLTIRNWLNGNIIGPRDMNNIRIIAEIVNDSELNRQIDETIRACGNERSIQVQIRKIIARMIINSIIDQNNEESTMYKLVNEVIGNLKDYAYISDVCEISVINKEVSSQYVNRLIEGDRE